ncbi:MAG: hypothetical protein HUU22_06460 [Phycisphaerae bacterium]|nr:hypothetical protein [Phycisphaerae bacterium]NUQ45656.1 hypothetical protein [Phycisphaerae bacterium]
MSMQPGRNFTPRADDFDPANQALSDALRKSFRVMKWLMSAVIVLYLFSGMFRVKPGEVGFVLRMGRIVQSNLSEGWHFAYPFPIDESRTMSLAGDRKVTVPFMFQLTEQHRLRGLQTGGSALLRPGRDHYLLTGDLNILHAYLSIVYRIRDAADYIANVVDVTPGDDNPPEHELMASLLAASAVEIAATHSVNDVYADRGGFRDAVRDRVASRLDALRQAGASPGLEVKWVEATSFEGFEAIMPPLAAYDEFLAVLASEAQKGQRISTARGRANDLLSRTAGSGYSDLEAAIDAEFLALRETGTVPAELRERTETLLRQSGGEVQTILKEAEAYRDRLVNEAAGDARAVEVLAAEYDRNPVLLLSRLRMSVRQEVLSYPTLNKKFVPRESRQVRLVIPRDPEQQERAARQRSERDKEETSPSGSTGPGEARPVGGRIAQPSP